MPYKSPAQRAYLHIQEPAVAAEWDKEEKKKKKSKKPWSKDGSVAEKAARKAAGLKDKE
jgi:hypothetical protein